MLAVGMWKSAWLHNPYVKQNRRDVSEWETNEQGLPKH